MRCKICDEELTDFENETTCDHCLQEGAYDPLTEEENLFFLLSISPPPTLLEETPND